MSVALPRPVAAPAVAAPELLIEAPVYDRLHALPTIATDLLAELDRARLVSPGALASDVVTIGSLLS